MNEGTGSPQLLLNCPQRSGNWKKGIGEGDEEGATSYLRKRELERAEHGEQKLISRRDPSSCLWRAPDPSRLALLPQPQARQLKW